MSNAQFETYGPSPAQGPPAHGGFDPYRARTQPYGVPRPAVPRTDSDGPGWQRHAGHGSRGAGAEYAAHSRYAGHGEDPEYGEGPEEPGDPEYSEYPQYPEYAEYEPYEDTYRPAYEAADAAYAPGARSTGGRRAAHRRRGRVVERVDGPMRRLVPQALVVAFLAGGTSAFVAKDKAIELNVDGRPRSLHTFADDVGELLAQEGVDVGAHDLVTPGPGKALASGDEIAVRHGRPLRLTLDGRRREVWTTADTVEAALRELGVRTEGAYVSVPGSRRIGRGGLGLTVRTERAVTVLADGRSRTVRTNAETVGEVVEQAGITLRGQDSTSAPTESFPRDGQAVTVLRITGGREIRDETIPFAVQRVDDPTVFRGTEVVERAGQHGLRRLTYALRTVNGVRLKPRRIGTEVVREPQTQVVKVGTRPLPTSMNGTGELDWEGLAACESGGRPDAVDSSGTYGGLYQFDTRTWRGLGGQGRPQDAPPAEQTMRAKKLYVRQGASPWPHCGGRLHR